MRFLVLVLALAVAAWAHVSGQAADNGDMQCPPPSYAVMTPTGWGCATTLIMHAKEK